MTRPSALSRGLMLGVGVLHLVPATAALSRRRVEQLYGVRVTDPDVELLLRHRAVLFGLVGSALVGGALVPGARRTGMAAGGASLAGYLVLDHAVPGTNAELERVRRIDVAALGALVAAGVLGRGELREGRAPGRAAHRGAPRR